MSHPIESPPNEFFTWQTIQNVDRSTTRAPIAVQSMTILSKSNSSRPIATENYISRKFLDFPCVQVPYNLEDITNEPYTDYVESEKSMCAYISAKINKRVKRNEGMAFVPHVSSIPTTPLKKPDGRLVEKSTSL